jgi:hypothetical protein
MAKVKMLRNYHVSDFMEDGILWKGEVYDEEELEGFATIERLIDDGYCELVEEIPELYVLASVDSEGNVVGLPQGGGSSTTPRIKAYDSLASAKRGARRHAGTIVKVTEVEIIEEANE